MTAKDSFTRIPLNDLLRIPSKDGHYEVVINHWWALDENENVLIFRKMSLQCNAKESISKRIITGKTHPGVEVRFVKCVFLPIIAEDFSYNFPSY